ncbi:Kinesin-like protein KIF13A [Orchesella cincta]|uniref:Kinesin-like protein KIF13A n=1 Tax=Orchesella cincta TaxID=48709 RepID=A0A1D2N8B8_ORCCI|nr:Kinesin-like protein KIF13A [Orchesella cincta]
MGKDKVKVGVRVRPLNAREKALMPDGSLVVSVSRDSNQIVLSNPQTHQSTNNNNVSANSNAAKKSFTFDNVFGIEVGQENIFDKLGEDLLSSAFEGYNACLFAYGQTGSGKSYTMLGSAEHRGVIPRLCDAIFIKIAEETANLNNAAATPSPLPPETPNVFKVEVSFMEIYNEKVRDLLVANKTSLKVREHNVLGPYVDGLSQLAVKSAEDIANLMAEGNKSRTVAATNMNSESSRSHAVFTIVLTQTMTDTSSGVTGEKVSRISLVDLAGSERAAKTGAVGERLKEGSNINKSLTTLGLVISKLAEGSSGNAKDGKSFIPYRDSVLTWLLKDNLGGNSRTIMIATVSPSPDNYEETLSTLRYADRAKKIVNNAVVNEDPNAKIIRELQAEVKQLRELLKHHVSDKVLNEQLNQSEKLMRQVSETWEEKLQRSEQATQERQAALEKMGISVQQSGISVEKDRFYLVNLNADPALNELLVYYLKEDRTVVGRPDASSPPDIQLTGLGIEQLHCELVIEPDQTLYLIPYPKAHTCVNGERIERRRILHHGDRILWGNHHFLRLNSPMKNPPATAPQANTPTAAPANGSAAGTESASSYEQASAEFSMKQLIMSDPIHEAVAKLESKHQKDKQVALEKQRQELERQFNALMHVLSPSSPLPPALPWDAQNYLQQAQTSQPNATTSVQSAAAKNNKIAEGLKLLKDFLLKANQMVREANEIASAMKIDVKYRVTLLIPPNNLTPNRPKGSLVAEPSIRVERDGYYPQIWSLEKLQNRLVDMREMYEDYCSPNTELDPTELSNDPPANFFEPDQPHVLLGIANVFLQALFYEDVTLKYPVPVINQQGEIVGRLHVEVAKITGTMDASKYTGVQASKLDNSLYEEYEDEEDEHDNEPKTVTVKELNENGEYVPVEVEYGPGTATHSGTGGVHLLRQGLQRRILIAVETSATVGQLPVVCDEIDQVSLGGITPRSTTLQRSLDSYQEEDLTLLREKWGEALKRRREYLDAHLQELANKPEKNEEEQIREKSLVSQWLTLTEERNAVLVPTPDSGVPGAPTNSSFKPEMGMEQHMPIIFLDIAEDILSAESSPHSPPLVTGTTAGLNSLLPKEHDSQFVALPMIRKSYGDFYSAWSDQRMTTESWALVSWDSSVHDCAQLNKPTPPGEVIYVILRVALRLSHPVQMEVMLRKRVCLIVRKNRSSLTERLRARFTMRKPEDLEQERTKKRTGVTYQVVSHLPKSSEQLETRESLASLAVSHGETYIEEYLRSVSAVDSILNLDRMRQSVYLREEQSKNRPRGTMNRSFQHQNGGTPNSQASMSGFMRKTLSVPNISQLFVGPTSGGSILGSNMKLSQLNGNPVSALVSPGTTIGASDVTNGAMGPRRIKPIRSESLANLSGFTSPSLAALSPSQQSPNQARPSSLNLGHAVTAGANTTPHTTKWTSMMTTVMEEESSGYGSQKSSEDSPTTTG